MRLLLVEDDADLAEVVILGLRQHHFAVDHAATVAEAVDHLLVTAYDIVCLDLGLPDGDGLELCQQIQSSDSDLQTPQRLIVLTARDAVTDRVAGLDAGADDYLIKPFSIEELAARIRALARRREQGVGPIVIGGLQVDMATHGVTRDGQAIELTGREFAVLRYLSQHAGQVVSAEELFEHCWDAHADPLSRSVRVILSRLRSKLGEPDPIETLKGVGYRLVVSP